MMQNKRFWKGFSIVRHLPQFVKGKPLCGERLFTLDKLCHLAGRATKPFKKLVCGTDRKNSQKKRNDSHSFNNYLIFL